MKKIYIIILSLFCQLSINAQSVYPGQHLDKIKQPLNGEVKAFSFDLKDVRLLDSPFRQNMERESKWILSLGVDRLLHSFRNTAGVYAGREGGYMTIKKLGGWESLDCELRGHSIGHIMSGLAYLYASTGDERYKIKADSLVAGLAEVQDILIENGQKGYISAYPENLINRNIAGKSVWAPWYTLHKVYAGLIDQYLYCDNKEALDIMKKAASWAYQKLMPLSEEQRALMLRNEFGGVNEAFYNLYAITGNPEHKKLAEFFYHADVIDPLAEHKADLYFKHANTFIPKVIGEARNYELHNSERSKDIANFFWNTVIDHQTYCTGGNSHKEKFIHSDSISKNLTGYTQETCNTNNMLKLTRHLFCWDANAKYADYYERALYNHILGQQDPQSGMVAYFLPMLPGAHKVYSTPENSFWCCVGTGFENHAKYGEAIYYHDNNGLYVNLFIPSELTWKEKEIKIKQETAFPEEGNICLTVTTDKDIKMPVYLRYPSWTSNVEVKVNGKKMKIKQSPSGYITIDRTWKNGDKIEVHYPMHLYLTETNDNPDKAAIMYGPLVLAGTMGTEGMKAPAPFSNPELYNDYYTYDYNVPDSMKTGLKLDKKNLEQYIKSVSGNPLTFYVEKENVRLEPIYRIHHQRYVVYWDLLK
ncbi:glycoside hydrolase family 127 protein [Dysgonomonas sp. GY75]|uniref:glycoside hydrolase family 127 protein n=1 Tax=Dysgonomonas sp. GY75 TaxID=2780419 RepID=UPI001883CA08|nr:glycoside hydrolase family 127 protein [Dysgonomonas sp. GY75]MBF0650143.1 glycoside hydrolase family 127 protein [Dysgonomonas sp. GY75]